MASGSPAALYYPHTRIQSEPLLKAGLLLWDQVDCIIPNGHLSTRTGSSDRCIREAEELLVKLRVPSASEKKRVHQRIEHLLAGGIPPWIHEELKSADYRHYLLYPEKLAAETWRLLQGVKLARLVGSGARDYQVPPALGLLLMSMLAEECAGTTRTKVTDRSNAYSWLMGVMTSGLGGDFLPQLNASHLSSTYDRLVTIAIRTVNVDDVPLEQLVAMRKREAASGSKDYRKLRLSFLKRTTDYVARLGASDTTLADHRELQRQYRLEMESDLGELKRELGVAARKVILSREMGVTVCALAGATLAAPVSPQAAGELTVLGVGALLRTGLEYREARRKALASHAMSWLYLAT